MLVTKVGKFFVNVTRNPVLRTSSLTRTLSKNRLLHLSQKSSYIVSWGLVRLKRTPDRWRTKGTSLKWTLLNELQDVLRTLADLCTFLLSVTRTLRYFGSTNEFQWTDQKPPRIDTLKAEKLINVSNQCIFFLIKSSRDPTFCGIFVCGRLQFKLKRQFISPRIGYYRESGFDSKLKARPIRGTRRMHVHVVDVLQGWEYWGEGKNKKWSTLEKVLLFWMSF